MGLSLADQLLKAGLGNKQSVQKANKQKRKKQKQQKHQKAPVVDEAALAQQKAQAEKAERDRQLNRQIKADADQKAIQFQIRQLIELNQLPLKGADQTYNFNDNNVVQNLLVTAEIMRLISQGRLAIIKFDDQYRVVPVPVAEKIQQRDGDCVVVLNQVEQSQIDDNDAYADFQVPDDLMW